MTFNSFSRKALAAAVAATVCGSASAAVTDRVYFSAAPLVLVWGTDASGNPAVVSDFVLVNTASGTPGTDLTAASVIPVITGSMTPVPNAPTGNSLYAITNPAAAPAGGGVVTDAGTAGQLDAADTYTAFGLGATVTPGAQAVEQLTLGLGQLGANSRLGRSRG